MYFKKLFSLKIYKCLFYKLLERGKNYLALHTDYAIVDMAELETH